MKIAIIGAGNMGSAVARGKEQLFNLLTLFVQIVLRLFWIVCISRMLTYS